MANDMAVSIRYLVLMLRSMLPLLAEAYGSNRLQALSAETDPAIPGPDNNPYRAQLPSMDFDGFRVNVSFRNPMGPAESNGACLCLQVAQNECYIAGKGCGISFRSLAEAQPDLDLLLAEEGSFADGEWIPGRRLNGDETAHLSLERPEILHVKFFTY